MGRPPNTMTVVYRNELGIDRAMVIDLTTLVNEYGQDGPGPIKGIKWEGRPCSG